MEHLELARKALRDRLLGMGMHPSMASELANGPRRPNIKTAAEIEKRIGIAPSAWVDGPPLEAMWAIIKRTAE